MPALPTGTVTFLFTDVEGSTRLWEQQPEAMRAALARHDTLIASLIEEHGGLVVKPRGEGDSHFCVFARADGAVAAASAIQLALHWERWPTAAPIQVRMALHTGTADLRDGDYYGPAVNRCARLRAIAHGGQVLMSRATASLVPGTPLEDLGEHRLKDLTDPERVHQLIIAGLPTQFPPLRSLSAFPHNLPIQITSFVGREAETSEVKRLLGTTRILTMTGTGGAGKTRLALQVGTELLGGDGLPQETATPELSFPDGVWFVDLAPIADATLVPQTVATNLGVREESGKPVQVSLIEGARAKRLLVILDNCEHVLEACARLVDALVRAGPHVRVLATSREALGIAGETAWRVPSLAVPSVHDGPVSLMDFPAVRLFVERATAAQPAFALTSRNAATVAAICRRLDGIPLAIELAAARVKALPVEQIAERLDQRFRLLTGGSRTALPRQQTLTALVGWSYDLLSEPERLLFERLAVFAGRFALEAAERVCAGGEVDEAEVFELLAHLVDKSLVLAEPDGHYRLLETLRQYARERLLERGDAHEVYTRHAAYYLEMVEKLARDISTRTGTTYGWMSRLQPAVDNVRAVLQWSIESGDAEQGLRLCGALVNFFYIRGHSGESRRWIEEMLAAPAAQAPTLGRGRALVTLARLAWDQLDVAVADVRSDEALDILRAVGDDEGVARCLEQKARVAIVRRAYADAHALAEEACAVARRLPAPLGGSASSLQALAQAHFYLGDFAAAERCLERSIAAEAVWGVRALHASNFDWLGHVATAQGNFELARERYREAMQLRRLIERPMGVAFTLTGMAGLAAAEGKPARAVRLAAVAARICEQQGVPAHRTHEATMLNRLPRLRDELGAEAFAAAWEAGRALEVDAAVAEAISDEAAER